VKLYLDANIIILGHEGEDLRKQTVLHRLWQCVSEDGGELITSAFSRLECLVLTLRSKDQALLADYDRFFGSESLTIVDVTTSVLTRAASLRAEYRFKTPDAIHLASAI
jgi:predicted nucleic acid-binding protein